MNPYQQLVSRYAALLKEGKALALGNVPSLPRQEFKPGSAKALFFSPHPDDECISGGLALRLMREAGMRLANVAVTQGSKKGRQRPRFRELEAACNYIGFELIATAPNGLEKVNPTTRRDDNAHWTTMVNVIADTLRRERPRVIFFPHEHDWNSTHIGTHFLIMDALQQLPDLECYLVETEFWGQMTDPNLMVEISSEDLADLVTATTFHIGEVERNPYHLLLPAWMMDNVRRGTELVGGQGGAAPDFTFAALYRLRKWARGQVIKEFEGGRIIPSSVNVSTLFP
jgi:LmbE family N-acetylglucosaminyl deacetylase